MRVRYGRTAAFIQGVLELLTQGSAHAAFPPELPNSGVLFDDFSYATTADLSKGGWIQRSKPGHPGLPGAQWGPGTLPRGADPDRPDNQLLRVQASTDGTGPGTVQAQLCHERKYLEGTYAARVRFSDTPVEGPDGDVVVQSFYAVSPLKYDLDPEFSEVDWEYLPNGGWGDTRTRLYSITWQTVRIEPWLAFNQAHEEFRPLGGWHTLIMQIANGRTRHILDGVVVAEHGGRNYPVVPMSINFNLWFSPGGQLPAMSRLRAYQQDIDWVLHVKNQVLSAAEIDTMVGQFRTSKVPSIDSVAPASPALPSTCDF